MKKHLFITILTMYFPILLTAQNEKNFIDQNYIEVSGKAETLIAPDEIYVGITLTEKNHKKPIEEQEKLLVANLKSLGIDTDKDFSVSNFNGMYTRHFLKRNEVEKVKEYQIIIHDGFTLSKTYSVLDQLNITNVKIIKVSHSEIEKIRRETKINALKAAKQKAKEYAKAIDQNIGDALFIQENDFSNYTQARMREFNTSNVVYEKDKFSNIDDLSFQKIKVTASILTRFELRTSKN